MSNPTQRNSNDGSSEGSLTDVPEHDDSTEANSDDKKDRRGWGRERRVIKRFDHPLLNSASRNILLWNNILIGLVSAGAIVEFLVAFTKSLIEGSAHVFFGFFFVMLAYFLTLYKTKIRNYLDNESATNLAEMVDQQKTLWLIFGVFGFIFLAVSITFKFEGLIHYFQK